MRYFFACTMLLSVMWGCGDSQSPLPSTNANTQMQPNTTRPDPNKPEQTQNNTSSKASTSNRSSTSQNIPQTTQTNHATQTNHTTQNYPIPFQDVPLSHPASMEIHNLYQLNLVQGIGKRRFRPHNNLTRAQFARLLQATFFPETEKNPPQKTLPFEDVPESHWAYSAVLSVYHGGYMSGFSATQFGPDQAMTREQALAALAKFLKLSGIPSTGFVEREFSDADQLSSWAQIPAFRALLHGLLGNHVLLLYRGSSKTSPPQRLLRPKEAVLRAEAASFMFFAYILQVEWGTPQNDDLLPGSS
ncbi:MAG: S-layer homology domain-containing protein, partial [Myxococcota bacterium]